MMNATCYILGEYMNELTKKQIVEDITDYAIKVGKIEDELIDRLDVQTVNRIMQSRNYYKAWLHSGQESSVSPLYDKAKDIVKDISQNYDYKIALKSIFLKHFERDVIYKKAFDHHFMYEYKVIDLQNSANYIAEHIVDMRSANEFRENIKLAKAALEWHDYTRDFLNGLNPIDIKIEMEKNKYRYIVHSLGSSRDVPEIMLRYVRLMSNEL